MLTKVFLASLADVDFRRIANGAPGKERELPLSRKMDDPQIRAAVYRRLKQY